MFTPDEILMLAKAGFNAQQIAGLSMVKEQPAPAPVAPVAPAPAPVAPVAPATAPVAPATASVAPATAPVAPATAPVAPATAPVAPATAPVAPVADPVLAELQKLTGLVQNSNILQSAQPKVQTPEEILAEIINPAPKGDNNNG